MKKFLLSIIATVMAATAFAEKTVTFNASEDYTADAKTLVLSKDGVTLTIQDGTLANKSEYRFYKGKDVTISSTAGNVKKITFNCTASGDAKYGPGCFTCTSGEYAFDGVYGIWEGNEASVAFNAKTNQVRATQVIVVIDDAQQFDIAAPTFSLENGTYKDAQKVVITAPEGYGIIYTTDGTTPTEGVGTQVATNTVEVTVDATASVKAITIDNSDPDNHSAVSSVLLYIYHELGSLEAPLTVKEARDFITAGEGLEETYVFTKGTVYQIDQINGTATYWIKGDDGSELEVFSGNALNNVAFTSAEELGEGDVVTVYGTLTVFKETYEYNSKNYIVAQDKSGRTSTVELLSPIALDAFTNNGFENWTDDVCDLWNAHTTASSATLSKSTDARTGTTSILVKGSESNVRLGSTEISLPAGCYLFTFYAKAVDTKAQARPGYVPVTLNEAKTTYKVGSYKYLSAAVEVGTEWTEIKGAFKLEEDATISLVIMNPKGQGDVLIDDATLTVTTEEVVAINDVEADRANGAIFNLAGQKVGTDFKGVVIKNGKKFFVK